MHENSKQEDSFSYTYSAKQQQEILEIRKKYLPAEEDKMARIRKLDASVTRKGTLVSVSMGIVGCLLLGAGMSCSMVFTGAWFLPGIVLGLIGIVTMAVAYPVFTHIMRKERARIAQQILELTDELLK
ncbi:MAG: hypothetical protein PUD50_12035 [Eubacteriales bacterium]|nr:hypothetical protein [Eubacteriales bacterium]